MKNKVLEVFFTESSGDRKSSDTAFFTVFVFWGLILLINAIFEIFFDEEFVSSSLVILILGLIVFYIVDQVAKNKKGK